MDQGASVPVYDLGDYGGCTYIASPQYPFPYLDSSNCHWSFMASDPANRIQIEVVNWHVSCWEIKCVLFVQK